MEHEKPQAQKTVEAVAGMLDPNTFPPPFEAYEVRFKHWPGDRVIVPSVMEGIITAVAVNATGGNMVLIDSGRRLKWYAENVVERAYQIWKDPVPPGPPGPQPFRNTLNEGTDAKPKADPKETGPHFDEGRKER